jgi:hypothetical protein
VALTYRDELIDLGFLISDTSDETQSILSTELENIQSGPNPFRSVEIFQEDFEVDFDNLNVEDRHGFEIQGPRRKAMTRACNYLLTFALKPDHSWAM